MLLRCLLAASWGLLWRLGRLLGPLGRLLGASWGILAASWQPLGISWRHLGALGGLLGALGEPLGASWRPPGASWGGLAGLEAEKWPWLQREHDFWSSQGRLLGGKVALARARAGFSGLPKIHGTVWAGGGCPSLGGSRPPLKLLAKAKSDTIMSLLAN